jgi:hypothetical protein
MVGEKIVVDLEVAEGAPPFVGHSLFVGFTHLLHFFVVLVCFGLGLTLQVFHVLDGVVALLVGAEALEGGVVAGFVVLLQL